MSANEMDEIARLRSRMLMKTYFVMFRQMVDPSKIESHMLDHYHWVIALEKDDKVFASGPLFAEEGAIPVGMTIFRASDRAEAEALAAGDPFIVSGAMTFDVQRWMIAEGRIGITVDFSDQTFSIA